MIGPRNDMACLTESGLDVNVTELLALVSAGPTRGVGITKGRHPARSGGLARIDWP